MEILASFNLAEGFGSVHKKFFGTAFKFGVCEELRGAKVAL
jgi:hypothetical protein